MLAAIAEHQPAIIYLAYPNNPTANLWDDAVIEQIIAAGARPGGDRRGLPAVCRRSYIDRLRAATSTCC